MLTAKLINSVPVSDLDTYLVSDLGGNDAYKVEDTASTGYQDISTPENWDEFGKEAKLTTGIRADYEFIRSEIKTLYDSYVWGTTAEEDKAYSKWFVSTQAERDLIHTAAEQTAFSVALYKIKENIIGAITPEATMPVGVGFTWHLGFDYKINDLIGDLTANGTTLSDVDILVDGVTIFATRITIDANEATNSTAATPYVITAGKEYINKGQKLEISVITAGTDAAGLNMFINGSKLL